MRTGKGTRERDWGLPISHLQQHTVLPPPLPPTCSSSNTRSSSCPLLAAQDEDRSESCSSDGGEKGDTGANSKLKGCVTR